MSNSARARQRESTAGRQVSQQSGSAYEEEEESDADELRSSEFVAVARGLVEAASRAGEALAAEAAADQETAELLGAMEAALVVERELQVRTRLAEAARALSTSLTAAEQNDELWLSLAGSSDALDRQPPTTRDLLSINELVVHRLPALLDELGYRKPPPSEHWVQALQRPLRVMVTRQPTVGWNPPVVQARNELRFFIMRLRQLADRALDEAPPSPQDADHPSRGRVMLAQAVRIGRDKAIPAAIGAAAASGMLAQFGSEQVSTLVATLGAAGAAALVRSGVEAAVALVLARRDPEIGLTPGEIAEEYLHRCSLHVLDIGAVLENPNPGEELLDISLEVALVRHDLFAMLSATADTDESAHLQRLTFQALKHLEVVPPLEVGFFDRLKDLQGLARAMQGS